MRLHFRYIPACAGETPMRPLYAQQGQVHPRVCGGNPPTSRRGDGSKGTSPRVRGKRADPRRAGSQEGYIPACAGETWKVTHTKGPWQVHPRVCGGNRAKLTVARHSYGTSPRVRGKLRLGAFTASRIRYIPACAGETSHPHAQSHHGWVHPRVCGGNGVLILARILSSGTSPRVRGKLQSRRQARRPTRYIPACAGETSGDSRVSSWLAVHPRVCGGNAFVSFTGPPEPGTSPRVRGKR